MIPAVASASPPASRRRSPGAAALAAHGAICPRCRDVAALGLPPRALCAAGRILFVAAMRARARRAS